MSSMPLNAGRDDVASAKGFAFSTPDALIAAQALNRRAALLTTDADFA
jgi:predicted nucleic acid-binding protein